MNRARAAILAAALGFAVMSVELTAVRVMAPHFGDSAYVWTNVIGVILLALAAGAWLGGRLADRGGAGLSLVLLLGGLWLALTPWLVDPLGTWLLPDDLALDAASAALVRGSLAATVLLFAIPTALAGMATPMLVVALARAGIMLGAASGHVAAWSTIGSLVGTFASTHLLIPGIGTRWTLVVCATTWLACGVLARPARAAFAALAAPLLLALFWSGSARSVAPSGAVTLAELESAYQYLAVVASDVDGRRTTQLRINEGLDSFHSIAIEGTPFTDGRYYDYYAALPFLLEGEPAGNRLRVLSIGAAAGTFERLLAHVRPEAEFDSVELDAEVTELARAHFGGYPERTESYSGIDGRVFVERSDRSYELVLVDAYERQVYIPAHVASREFFGAVRARLVPGGIVAVNVGGRTFEDPMVAVVASTMAHVFGVAQAFRVPQSRNFMVVARHPGDATSAPLDPTRLRAADAGADTVLAGVIERVARASAWRTFGVEASVLTDDRPFLDSVQDRALARRIASAPLPIDGDVDPEIAAQHAFAALRGEDLSGARAAIASAARPTATLRFYAGDLRWLEHDVLGAKQEYLAARELAVPAELEASLRQRLQDVEELVSAIDRADSIAVRNAWLAALSVLALSIGFSIAMRLTPSVAN